MNAPPPEIIQKALDAAAHSPCHKSKRGVVAFRPHHNIGGTHVVIDVGYNGPPDAPGGYGCDGSERCRADCAKRCVHAEMRAIRGLHFASRATREVTQLVHVEWGRSPNGAVVLPCDGPSCWQCSREILDMGLGGIWLYEKILDSEGHHIGEDWNFYDAKLFHEITLQNCGIHRRSST